MVGRPVNSRARRARAYGSRRVTRSAAMNGGDSDGGQVPVEPPMSQAQKMAIKAISDMWSTYASNVKRGLRNRPHTSSEDFFGNGGCGSPDPTQFAEFWGADDESRLMEEWNHSLMKHCIGMIGDNHWELKTLWKISIRLFGIDPLQVMEIPHDLEVSTSDNDTVKFNGQDLNNPIWSKGFCFKLGRIMCHPFWRGRQAQVMMTFVIQYAVKCRQDDRRIPHSRNPTSCKILDQLFSQEIPSGMSIHQWHVHLRKQEDLELKARVAPCIESDLLFHLGTAIVPDARRNLQDPSVVTTLDLTRVITALETLHTDGLPINMPTEGAYQLLVEARGTRSMPVGVEELQRAYSNCWLNQRRRCTVAQRRQVEEDNRPGAPGVLGRAMPEAQYVICQEVIGEDDPQQDIKPQPTPISPVASGSDGRQTVASQTSVKDSPSVSQRRFKRSWSELEYSEQTEERKWASPE
ncbi:hypothetical protein G7Z17_g5522 [Cylindrodendrum hubeiense]|uniref:Uncharacterized protein n=1 Tax=Cylindrodendrum hubeiense TaxID=595255 RepID=A0A9P5LHS1_9HYPO|nr:hypothetical protein G7Z17_g5522 [Cylindrodendrum hubeiense]